MKPTAEGPRFKSSAEILANAHSASVRNAVYLIASKALGLEHFLALKEAREGRAMYFARGMSVA